MGFGPAVSATGNPAQSDAVCGIDVGTQGVRAVVLDRDGTVLGAGAAMMGGDVRDGVRHEQDPDQWWSALVEAVRAALAQAGDRVRVGTLALDATSGSVVVEAQDGSHRGPALMYDDARAGEQAARAQALGAELWTALGYRMQPSWALPKTLWLIEHGALSPGDRIAHQSDHLVRRLTGTAVATDTSNALKTGVDLRSATWPVDLFTELGLPTALLPEVVTPGVTLGVVTTEAAAQTGLPVGTSVRAGMTDGCAAQIAAGALRPGNWSSTLGTTLVIKGSTAELVHDPYGAVYCHRNPDGGWLPGGASSTGAGVIGREFGDLSAAELDTLTEQARVTVPSRAVTYALSGMGERFPFVAARAHGYLASDAMSAPQRFEALCRSIAYVERLAYDVLAVLGADVSGTVSLSGGGSRNGWWNQLRTDVLDRPTMRPQTVQAAMGMAILAAAEPGHLAETAERMVRVDARYQPDAARGAELRIGYENLVGELAESGWLDTGLAEQALAVGAADERSREDPLRDERSREDPLRDERVREGRSS